MRNRGLLTRRSKLKKPENLTKLNISSSIEMSHNHLKITTPPQSERRNSTLPFVSIWGMIVSRFQRRWSFIMLMRVPPKLKQGIIHQITSITDLMIGHHCLRNPLKKNLLSKLSTISLWTSLWWQNLSLEFPLLLKMMINIPDRSQCPKCCIQAISRNKCRHTKSTH